MPLHCLILFNLSTLLFLTLGGNVCACDTSLHTTTLPAPVIAVTTPANTPTAILPSNYRAHPHYLRTADPAMPTLTPLTPSGDILPAAPSYPVPQGFQALVLLAATLRPRRKNPSSYFYDATTVAATSGSPASTYAQRRITQHHKAKTGLYYYGYRYYDPVTGRWPSRDPLGDEAFLLSFTKGKNEEEVEAYRVETYNNLYAFVKNTPITSQDYKGLKILKCMRPVSGFPYVGNHAYIYDTTTKKTCGMSGMSGKGESTGNENDLGPSKHHCVEVPGSKGKEKEIMKCCDKHALDGAWIPKVHDCHTAVDKCIKKSGLIPPKLPRMGKPECCWDDELNPLDSP